LLAVLSEDKIIKLIDLFFASNDDFIKRAGFTVGVFKAQINKLREGGYYDKLLEKFNLQKR